MSSFSDFLQAYPQWAAQLSADSQAVFQRLCQGAAHLRRQRAQEYFSATFKGLCYLEQHPCRDVLMDCLNALWTLNWSTTPTFFKVLAALPQDAAFIENWSRLAQSLVALDIDVGLHFIDLSPQAIEKLGPDEVLPWGMPCQEALLATRKVWKAASAYLEEAIGNQCRFTRERWRFFLAQAGRVAEYSPAAAEAFIRLGKRACLLLSDDETSRWVGAGIDACRNAKELIDYFSINLLKSLEFRDGIAAGVKLKSCSQTLSILCEALLGHTVRIRSNATLFGFKGFNGGAATDGQGIYLPDMVPNFGMFKLMALHQAMLLDRGQVLEEAGKIHFDPLHLHLYADKRLVQRLPGITAEMKRQAGVDLVADYPYQTHRELTVPLPWWGDILPDLVATTNATISTIKQRAAEQFQDLPPELVEALLNHLMAEGQRDVDPLWEMLSQIAETIEFDSPDAEQLPENCKTFLYREWDANLADYKLEWCLVRQRPIKEDPNSYVADVRTRLHGLISLIRRQFARLKPEQLQKFRAQPYGDALDIDALIAAMVDKRCGSVLSENVYIRRDKRTRDVAVLFLLDMSGSTEEQIQGRQVIDIQKEAMVLMAEALDALGDPYAMYGFTSEGRFRVDMFSIKEFHQSYDDAVKFRLGNVAPKELTRMGAVMRHAIYKMDNVPAAIKLMIILTDGRPYDLEYGGLDYAIADTKKAFQEARTNHIHTFIITSDQKGADYLKQISPQTQSIILRNAELLPTMLPAIYRRLTF
jgi:hypothetical protein